MKMKKILKGIVVIIGLLALLAISYFTPLLYNNIIDQNMNKDYFYTIHDSGIEDSNDEIFERIKAIADEKYYSEMYVNGYIAENLFQEKLVTGKYKTLSTIALEEVKIWNDENILPEKIDTSLIDYTDTSLIILASVHAGSINQMFFNVWLVSYYNDYITLDVILDYDTNKILAVRYTTSEFAYKEFNEYENAFSDLESWNEALNKVVSYYGIKAPDLSVSSATGFHTGFDPIGLISWDAYKYNLYFFNYSEYNNGKATIYIGSENFPYHTIFYEFMQEYPEVDSSTSVIETY